MLNTDHADSPNECKIVREQMKQDITKHADKIEAIWKDSSVEQTLDSSIYKLVHEITTFKEYGGNHIVLESILGQLRAARKRLDK